MHQLLLIPSALGEAALTSILPQDFLSEIADLSCFIVEDARTARRFLRAAGYRKDFEEVCFHLLNQHTDPLSVDSFLDDIQTGSIGLLSEAGVPCVADPGAKVVALAHRRGIAVKPLVGPSSLLLALMASGMNGQCFAFQGYLPIEKGAREKRIKSLEQLVIQQHQTQLLIETPYRNNALLESLCKICSDSTWIGVASNITQGNAFYRSQSVADWKKAPLPDLHKQNTVFLIGQAQ